MTKEWNFLQELVFNFGHELASNPTQTMMEQCFAAAGLNWRYVQFEFDPDTLQFAVEAMKRLGFRGGNCTMPYKVELVKHLDRLGESASLIGAVNCVVRVESELVGENTDGKGFLQSFRDVADPQDQNVVLLGAGGAARAIAVELALAGASQFTVVNRTPERGQELAKLINEKTAAKAEFVRWDGTFAVPTRAHTLVDATSIGMGDDAAEVAVDFDSLRSDLVVADVIVSPPNTHLIRTARDRGCTAIDGLGMVVNQALIAFKLWTGIDADATVMRAALAEVLDT
jgi:shikimate dehydrogenase